MFTFKKQPAKDPTSTASVPTAATHIVVVDVGCRWGFAERFLSEACQKSFKVFGFDPDAEECARLQASYAHLPDGYVTCVPLGLARHAGTRQLYQTKEPACSSLHAPLQFLAQNYPALDCISLQQVVSTAVTTLAAWAQQNQLQAIDYLKLDTQGSELEILQGGDDLIQTARCIDIEVEFNPIYEGQTLFGETDTYLRSKGFVLWRLSNLVHYSLGGERLPMPDNNSVCFDTNVRQESPAFGGQLFWADARYVHRDVLAVRSAQTQRYQHDVKLFEALHMVDVLAHMQRMASDNMSFVSYAQNCEDLMLWRALKHVDKGFYIDVGANDPVTDSVTKAFYDRGWHGINVEPLPSHHADLLRARPRDINLQCAAGAQAGQVDIWACEIRGWATASADVMAQHAKAGHQGVIHRVPMSTLKDICTHHVTGDIHFLKIDVEGFEQAVLDGMDFSRFRPWLLVVEANRPNSTEETHAHWEPGLLSHGYVLAYADGLNRYYAAQEHTNLLAAFRYPPNVFDDFVRADQLHANVRAQQAEDRAAQALAKAQQAQSLANQCLAQLQSVHASRSWRITAPLRALKKAFTSGHTRQ